MIRLNNITKYYSDGKNVSLGLRKVSLELKRNEFVAVTGESGSGKSTLLNVLSGIDTYEEGELYFDNNPTSHFDMNDWEDYRNKKIGFIFQEYNLIDSYTVLDNVLSTLYIQGYDKYIAQQKAVSILKKVSLLDKLSNKASQLSSGQKQRLSIARALAKDTEVIMADEPTGNLDVKNGKEIIKLLYEISKEKLVIIVTHNYDEVKEYVTRKIVMYDGEIQSDMLIDQEIKQTKENTNNNNKQFSNNMSKYKNKKLDLVKKFALLNMKSQPKKVILLLFFFLVTSLVSFVFLGGILSEIDDISTKVCDNKAFLNNDPRRIVVRKSSGDDFDDIDFNKIKNIKNVACVDKYDIANEINYFYRKNIDYKMVFRNEAEEKIESKDNYSEFVLLKNFSNFVTSCNFFKEEDLSGGRLPQKIDEIIISSKDTSLLGEKIDFYFTSKKYWAEGDYAHMSMKVVGIVDSSLDKVYFSDKFEKMIAISGIARRPVVNYYYSKGFAANKRKSCVLMINNDLRENEVSFSKKIMGKINFNRIVYPALSFGYETSYKDRKKSKYPSYDIVVSGTFNDSSESVLEVNEDLYYKLYWAMENQYTIYAKDYAYVDNIILKLGNMGYETVSPIKVSAVSYSRDKVEERLRSLFIYILAVLITCTLEVIIIKSLLRYKKRDFVILKMIGMKNRTVSRINYLEISSYKIFSIVLSILLIIILYFCGVNHIVKIVRYYNIKSFIIYILINIITLNILIFSYNRYLYKHFNIISLNN